eukprot:Nk52_evm9s343 gene=Nk52_evmTU9s343
MDSKTSWGERPTSKSNDNDEPMNANEPFDHDPEVEVEIVVEQDQDSVSANNSREVGDVHGSVTSSTLLKREGKVFVKCVREINWVKWIGIELLISMVKLIVIFVCIGIIGAYSLNLYLNPTVGSRTYKGADFKWEYNERYDPKMAINSSSGYGVKDPFHFTYTYKGNAMDNSSYNFLLDAHVHSSFSDGRLSASQVIEWAIANGFNGIVLTDHNMFSSSLLVRNYARRQYPGFVVIPGFEFTTCRIHLNIIGINDTLPWFTSNYNGEEPYKFDVYPSNEDIKQIITETHAYGGVVMVNHIPWSTNNQNWHKESRLQDHPSREELLAWGVDFFEVVNQEKMDYQSLSFCDYSQTVNTSTSCGVLTGTDMHLPSGVAAWSTLSIPGFNSSFYNYTTSWNSSFTTALLGSVAMDSLTLEGLVMTELKGRRTGLLYDPSAIQYQQVISPFENDEFYKTAQFYYLGEYIENLFYFEDKGQYDFQNGYCNNRIYYTRTTSITYFCLYIILIFFILESGYIVVISIYRYYVFRRECLSKERSTEKIVPFNPKSGINCSEAH